MQETYLPDTSVIVDGRFTRFILGNIPSDVIISEALISEIEHQANEGRSIGFTGLEELQKLRKMKETGEINLQFYGRRPNEWQIKRAKSGEVDEMIRQAALDTNSILVTGDYIQKSIAEIKGIRVMFLEPLAVESKKIESYFTENTMSVHLKANTKPRMKVGRPGDWRIVYGDEIISSSQVSVIANDIVERARNDDSSLVEMDIRGATVVQLGSVRVVITRPPVSNGIEITAVKPTKKLSIEDYNLPDSLMLRFRERAEGIIVSGRPGAGKSTFVQALAEFYNSQGKIVKTLEKPRDLQVSEDITQLTQIEGSMEKTGDLLLLERPDYTVFDEIRTTGDFIVFTDLRLAGVGMIGVIHASRPVDSIQRFVGKIDLGVIPQIMDTVIFVENGAIKNVLDISYSVKIPSGMNEEDLARPVIEIKDFFTGRLLYEIYTFGEQVVVVPVKVDNEKDLKAIVKNIEKELEEIPHKIDITSSGKIKLFVPEQFIGELIGKGGRRVKKLEEDVGMKIDIEEMKFDNPGEVTTEVRTNKINLYVGEDFRDKEVEILVNDSPLFIARVSKNGIIQIRSNSVQGRALRKAISEGAKIRFSVL